MIVAVSQESMSNDIVMKIGSIKVVSFSAPVYPQNKKDLIQRHHKTHAGITDHDDYADVRANDVIQYSQFVWLDNDENHCRWGRSATILHHPWKVCKILFILLYR